jgi:hypothetical protein
MANKYLALVGGRIREILATVISSGAVDDGKIVALDSTGRLDTSVMPVGMGAETKSIQASEALSAGDLVNIWNSAGSARVRKADASAAGKEANGFVLSSVSNGASATVYLEGTVTGLGGLVVGERMFLSDITPGAVVNVAPTGTNKVVQYVGTAVSASEFSFEPDGGVILA